MLRRVAVTGCCGRIGRGVIERLKTRVPCEILGIDIQDPAAGSDFDNFQKLDLATAVQGSEAGEQLHSALKEVDYVIHCAAWPGPSAQVPFGVREAVDVEKIPIGLEDASPWDLYRDNLASTNALVEAGVATGLRRFVFSSTAFAMGFSHKAKGPGAFVPKTLPLTEQDRPQPFETYGLSKAACEELLSCAARTSPGFVSLRFPNIIKREMWGELPWPAPTPGDARCIMLWNYVSEDDVIQAHVEAILREEATSPGSHEIYNISAPDIRFDANTLDLMETVLDVNPKTVSFREDLFAHSKVPLDSNFSLLSSKKATDTLGIVFKSWKSSESTLPSEERESQDITVRTGTLRRGSSSAREALRDTRTKFFDITGFGLESGKIIPKCREAPNGFAALAYSVHGDYGVVRNKKIVLVPTSFDATTGDLEYLIGPSSQYVLNTDEHLVIVVNQLGNGVSFSPSHQLTADSASGKLCLRDHEEIYQYSIGDNVRAQKKLLEDEFGIDTVDIVYGYSMGAMQGLDWAWRFPDAVRKVIAVCGTSRCGDLNRVFLDSLEAALCTDPAYDPGYFSSFPHKGLEAFSRIYAGWGVGARFYLEHRFLQAGYDSGSRFVDGDYIAAFAGADPNDLLSQIRTWKRTTALGATEKEGLSSVAAEAITRQNLAKVKADILYMPCDSDKYFTLTEAQRETEWLINEGDQVVLKPISSRLGHRAGDPRRPSMKHLYSRIRFEVLNFLEEPDFPSEDDAEDAAPLPDWRKRLQDSYPSGR